MFLTATIDIPEDMDDKLKDDFRLTNAIMNKIRANQIQTNNLMLQFYTILKSIQSKIRKTEQKTNKQQSLRDETNRHFHLQSLTKDKTIKIMKKAAEEFEQKNLLSLAKVPVANNKLDSNIYSKPDDTVKPSLKKSFDDEIKEMEDIERKKLESLHAKNKVKQSIKTKRPSDEDKHKLLSMQDKKKQIIENEKAHQESEKGEGETNVSKGQTESEHKTSILETPVLEDNIKNSNIAPSSPFAFETIENSHLEGLMNDSVTVETVKHQDKPLKRKQMEKDCTIKPMEKIAKIVNEEYQIMYPWAKEAAKNRGKASPISEDVEVVRCNNLQFLLSTEMKEKLATRVKHTEHTMKKITKLFREDSDGYTCVHNECTNVKFPSKSKWRMIRHILSHLGAYQYRCTFCDYMRVSIRDIYHHYASVHGLPKDWMMPVSNIHQTMEVKQY